MKIDKKVILYGGSMIISLVGIYYLASNVLPKTLVTLTKASPATKVSLENSYVLGQRILSKADGKDKCIINVYVLDERSQGVKNKVVNIQNDRKITDNNGKATFEFKSETEKQVTIEAEVDGVIFPQSVKCTFRN